MPDLKTLRLILGDQLNPNHQWFTRVDATVCYVMMEMRQETDYATHHIQKIAAFFAAMRHFANYLRQKGHKVIYLALDNPENKQNLADNLKELILKHKFYLFEYQLPDEYRLDLQLKQLTPGLGVAARAFDSDHFLNKRNEVGVFFQGKKRFLMESFYRFMRKKHGILMESNKPVGGKWNYDQKNRNPYTGKVPIPKPLVFSNNVSEICQIISKTGLKTFGQVDPNELIWPVTRSQSLELLDYFVENLLPFFGVYQDAMTRSNWHLFHSRLSFSLNTKMISPREVLDSATQAWQKHPAQISLPQIEGFVRQVLGWREYMRGLYWRLMPELFEMNFLRHQAKLPNFYWTGQTRMNCLKQTISQSLKHAYAHHIQRLMITGNFALLAGIDPARVDEWYLGIYIDAIQWVELPNTRGMSQFADGGVIATKPYVSSARYINRMSDYCASCAYDWKKRCGPGACPFNSLYWDFFARHKSRLAKIPRIGMAYRNLEKMAAGDKQKLMRQARFYLENLEEL
jgi:deoxyribodipyrimidine photolyase-related protein